MKIGVPGKHEPERADPFKSFSQIAQAFGNTPAESLKYAEKASAEHFKPTDQQVKEALGLR